MPCRIRARSRLIKSLRNQHGTSNRQGGSHHLTSLGGLGDQLLIAHHQLLEPFRHLDINCLFGIDIVIRQGHALTLTSGDNFDAWRVNRQADRLLCGGSLTATLTSATSFISATCAICSFRTTGTISTSPVITARSQHQRRSGQQGSSGDASGNTRASRRARASRRSPSGGSEWGTNSSRNHDRQSNQRRDFT